MDFDLILNKYNLLKKKVEQVALTHFGQLVFHHMAVKFKWFYYSFTGRDFFSFEQEFGPE